MIANFYLGQMKTLQTEIFNKVERIAKTVVKDLKGKGLIVPSKEKNGNIRFNDYIVKKETTGFYSVKDLNGRFYVERLNLPQTAAILANDLALGKILDNNLIGLDISYGYKMFDKDLFKHHYQRTKNTVDEMIYYKTQMDAADMKAKYIKQSIDRSFLKLSRIA